MLMSKFEQTLTEGQLPALPLSGLRDVFWQDALPLCASFC